MRRVLFTVIAASLLTPILAAERSAPIVRFSACDEQGIPPVEFDYEPNVAYHVAPMPPDLVRAVCNVTWVPAIRHMGCAFTGDDDAKIIIRDDLTPGERACVMRHERAHINGWVHPEGGSTQPRGPYRKHPIYTPVE